MRRRALPDWARSFVGTNLRTPKCGSKIRIAYQNKRRWICHASKSSRNWNADWLAKIMFKGRHWNLVQLYKRVRWRRFWCHLEDNERKSVERIYPNSTMALENSSENECEISARKSGGNESNPKTGKQALKGSGQQHWYQTMVRVASSRRVSRVS